MVSPVETWMVFSSSVFSQAYNAAKTINIQILILFIVPVF